MSRDKSIILSQEVQNLIEEIEKMQTEMSMLMLEYDELRYVVCRNLEANYMVELGAYEYKAYEVQCLAMRFKRKMEMIQAKLNRQEKIDEESMEMIESKLDTEFVEYQAKLNEQIDKMNSALARLNCSKLTEEEKKELKKLYRKIVKALHPDINPRVTKEQLALLDKAVMAFKEGDLETIKIISDMVSEHTLPDLEEDTITVLEEKKANIVSSIENIHSEIAKLKERFPYNVKELLEDEAAVKAKREEYENLTEGYNEIVDLYKKKIREMIK